MLDTKCPLKPRLHNQAAEARCRLQQARRWAKSQNEYCLFLRVDDWILLQLYEPSTCTRTVPKSCECDHTVASSTLLSFVILRHRDHWWPPCERSHFSSASGRIPSWMTFWTKIAGQLLQALELAVCRQGSAFLARRGSRAGR